MATTESVNVIRLPYRGISDWSEDSLVALNRNFSEIEFYLGQLQKYMNDTGFTGLTQMIDFMNCSIIDGLDTEKPVITKANDYKYRLYYATDTKKVYYAKKRS